MEKLTSRKFWISVAAFLASIGTSIAGLAISEPAVAIVGIVCTVLSGAIYAACEAYVDGQDVAANGVSKVVTVTSDSAQVAKVVFQPEIDAAAATK